MDQLRLSGLALTVPGPVDLWGTAGAPVDLWCHCWGWSRSSVVINRKSGWKTDQQCHRLQHAEQVLKTPKYN